MGKGTFFRLQEYPRISLQNVSVYVDQQNEWNQLQPEVEAGSILGIVGRWEVRRLGDAETIHERV